MFGSGTETGSVEKPPSCAPAGAVGAEATNNAPDAVAINRTFQDCRTPTRPNMSTPPRARRLRAERLKPRRGFEWVSSRRAASGLRRDDGADRLPDLGVVVAEGPQRHACQPRRPSQIDPLTGAVGADVVHLPMFGAGGGP